ncbi:hypothetical protein AGMMS50256_39110 [Betaproteobacteria bacterium]|nr:hypothetical protein AGMMS50256_39110 [Betaproteobacteria bacterium]
MPKAHNLCRGYQRLRPLIELALREGWNVSRTEGGYLMLIKADWPPIFTGSALAQLHRIGTPGDRNG